MSRNLQFVELFFIPKKFERRLLKHLDGGKIKTSDGKENNLVAHFSEQN